MSGPAVAGPQPRPLPLVGMRVLDLGRFYQGPWAGFLLAMAGADVVKVEPPGGEPARHSDGSGAPSVSFAVLNSNKRCVTLDLKRAEGRELLVSLAREVDVVVENFSPGVMDGLGVGPDVLLAANPRLVYGAATGYGIDGPDRDRVAMDLTVQAHAGVMSVTGFPGQPPLKAGVAFIDFLGGAHLYGGIVTALLERERTGAGRVVDVAMVDTVYPTLASSLVAFHREGVVTPAGNRHAGGSLAPYNVYPAADGHVAILVVSERQWQGLAQAMGRPTLTGDERFSSNDRRVERMDEVDELVGAWTATLGRDEVAARCARHKVPAAAVRSVGEVVDDPHLRQRGALEEVDHPLLGRLVLPQSPLRFRESPPSPLVACAAPGAHTDEVLGEWLGLSPGELAGLRAGGVL